jgi:hypothetical protein
VDSVRELKDKSVEAEVLEVLNQVVGIVLSWNLNRISRSIHSRVNINVPAVKQC